jgi:phosphoribosylformimino-5-aminoimidazole carboxamide ribotide isomerase
MQIYPAIDLRGGQCVRLKQGDYSQETVFGADPAEMARRWVSEGATYLHIVDLDGAKAGKPVNGASIWAIVKAIEVPCQLGGGLRTEDDIKQALGWGLARVIVGTKALQSPGWLTQMAQRFPGRIVLGIDAKAGKVATQGWLDVSEMGALELARTCAKPPLSAIIYTDISRDGAMTGVNVEATVELAWALTTPVIASGGVASLDDLRALKGEASAGIEGVICGRALYDGRIDAAAAIKLLKD